MLLEAHLKLSTADIWLWRSAIRYGMYRRANYNIHIDSSFCALAQFTNIVKGYCREYKQASVLVSSCSWALLVSMCYATWLFRRRVKAPQRHKLHSCIVFNLFLHFQNIASMLLFYSSIIYKQRLYIIRLPPQKIPQIMS